MHLPMIKIELSDNNMAKLEKNVWSKNYVEASINCGGIAKPIQLRYRGGHTREYSKKSFEINTQSGIRHLNAEYDDPSMIRNALSFRLFEWIGVPSPQTQHCVIKLNGKYLGVYLEIEGVDALFFERRAIPFQSLFYAGNDLATFGLLDPDHGKLKQTLFDGYELILGTQADRVDLENFIFDINTWDSSEWMAYVQSRLDIDNYLRWLAGAVCTGNYDGFNQNYAIYQYTPLKLYRIIPWDYEGTWGRNCFGERCSSKSVRITGYNKLTEKLLTYPTIKNRYREIMSRILATSFTLERLEPQLDELMYCVHSEIQQDTARRWSFSDFNREAGVIRSYIRNRRQILQKGIACM